MSAIDSFFEVLAGGDAAGLFLRASARPAWRAGGVLVPNGDPLPGREAFHEMLLDLTAKAGCLDRFHDARDVTFAYTAEDKRFRIHIWREEGGHALFAAPLRDRTATLDELGLHAVLDDAVRLESGIVVLAGPPRSGRTTTVAAVLGAINENQSRHIVSIEREPGFLLQPRRSLLEQILVGTDAPCTAAAGAVALSAGADVIAFDAVEDGESLDMATEAAESGALVFAVTDAYDLADAFDRLLGLFTGGGGGLARARFAAQVRLAACQHLVRTRDGTCAVAAEVLAGSPALQAILRERRLADLPALLDERRGKGVRSLEQSLADLVHAGALDRQVAQHLARNRARLDVHLAESRGRSSA